MKYLIAAVSLFLVNNSFAMFCPTNFNQVYEGDTMDHVTQTCGIPHSKRSQKNAASLSEEWVYYVKTQFNTKSTSKMTVIFANDKVVNINLDNNQPSLSDVWQSGSKQPVINIALNNQGPTNVASSNACGSTINMGDTTQQVEFACGKPVQVKQNHAPDTHDNSADITLFIYGGPNAATLVFENGLLKERILQ